MQVVGIMLVHNEDRFLDRAARNVLGFCDRLIVCDHKSTDGTGEIARQLATAFPGDQELAQGEEEHDSGPRRK